MADVAPATVLQPTVLIFDSGVGGLSVYQEIRQLMPDSRFIYAFDNAGFPYGEQPAEVIIQRVCQLVTSISHDYSVDLVVIACNTASTVVLPALRARFQFPVVGVVPAIKPAVALTRNGVIGLLATKATVSRQYTHDLIAQFASTCRVELLGSSRLVELAEEKLHGQTVDLSELADIVAPWLILPIQPDTIVLGCTHFPLLKAELQSVMPVTCKFIDSGTAIARRVTSLLTSSPLAHQQPMIAVNTAFCTQIDSGIDMLRPVLMEYGFSHLMKYSL